MTREMLHLPDNMLHEPQMSPDAAFQQLDRIARSQTFQGSDNLISLLQYLVREAITNPEAPLKEYAIATDVFGRNSDFDPRIDSVVRVQAKRLRGKLQEYYETEGKSDTILVDLPKGHYKVALSYVEPSEIASDPLSEPTAEPRVGSPAATITAEASLQPVTSEKSYKYASFALAILLVIVIGLWVLMSASRQQTQTTVSSDRFGPIWEPFFKENVSTLVVLSNPPVYRFSNDSDPSVLLSQSIEIAPEKMNQLGKELKNKPQMRQDSAPRLILSSEDYTGMGESIGLFNIANMFQSTGKTISLKQSRTVSAEDLKNHNVILLGSAWVNDWVEKLPIKEEFTYSVHATILNNNPQSGEEREYKPLFNQQTGDLIRDFALITVRPGVTDAYRFMTLSGILSEGTQAASEYVSRKEYLDGLNQRLQQLSPSRSSLPKYFQVLLRVDVDNNIPTTVSIIAIHTLEVSSR